MNRYVLVPIVTTATISIFTTIVYILITSDDDEELPTSKYCNLESCGQLAHSMCKYEAKLNPECLNEPQHIGFDDEAEEREEREMMLSYHNNLFLKKDRMVWDEELAEIAQRWANQSSHHGDQCQDTPTMKVSQYHTFFYIYDEEEIQEDVRHFAFQHLYSHRIKYIDNLIQTSGISESREKVIRKILFGNATNIGCGFVQCYYRPGRQYSRLNLVCNYGPYTPRDHKLNV